MRGFIRSSYCVALVAAAVFAASCARDSVDSVDPAGSAIQPRAVVVGPPGPANSVISGVKFNDLNGDGVADPGEPGLSGWTIRLYRGTTLLASAVTDVNGAYDFTEVPPITSYRLCEVLVAGWTQTFPVSGPPCTAVDEAPVSDSVRTRERDLQIANFGNWQPPAQPDALFILIDEDGIDNGPRYFPDGGPYTSSRIRSFTASDVNDDKPGLARRSPLRFFNNNVGLTIWLVSGQVGDEGWHAPKTIPLSWATAGPTTDGLRNFLGVPSAPFPHFVGPGLGTGSNPESRLDKIPNVMPLRAEGLFGLIGRSVCALVWDSDISTNYGPINASLKGEKLGVAAFLVQDVVYLGGFSSNTLPRVKVQIQDAITVCGGSLALHTDAPVPSSSSVPSDVRPNNTIDNNGYM